MFFFFDKKKYSDRECNLIRLDSDSKSITEFKILDNSLKEFLLENEICDEKVLTIKMLSDIRNIGDDILSIDVFYKSWNANETKYTILCEFLFYKRKLKREIRKLLRHYKRVDRLKAKGKKTVLRKKNRDLKESLKDSKNIEKQNLSTSSKDTYIEDGDKFYLKKSYSKALNYYEKALLLDKKDGDLYSKIGNAKEKMGELKEAKDIYSVSLTLKPKNQIVYYYRGRVNQALGNIEDSKKDYEMFKNRIEPFLLPPEHTDVYLNNIKK